MGLEIGQITIDCADPQRMAEFWSAALGAPVEGAFGDFVFLKRPDHGGPSVILQRVPEESTGKNRLHVDLTGEPRAEAVPRLTMLGATVIAEHEVPGLAWTVLADPEGNQFCVGERRELQVRPVGGPRD
jgi:catechol 2,3-dioxygenase-like lactoylglutathione lyase family enzyme